MGVRTRENENYRQPQDWLSIAKPPVLAAFSKTPIMDSMHVNDLVKTKLPEKVRNQPLIPKAN